MDPTDFLLLYQELGLRPGSGIDDFKLAYRRRIADLHPDRQRGAQQGNAELARDRLQRLTLLYGAAIAFHRRHGRLPGASVAPRTAEPSPAAAVAATPASGGRKRWLLLAMAVALLGAIGWQWFDSDDGSVADTGEESSLAAGRVAEQEAVSSAPAPQLRLGMRMRDVLDVEKEPITRGEDRWDYGPSWIAFERGKVTDWYSSPLRPLRYATTHPKPGAAEEPAR
ncbi:MAG: J domain-containing protein [Dokdonella sp.]